MNDIEILKGLISLIKVHNGKFSDDDIALLKGIYRIVNDRWITIHPHGDDSDDYRRIKLEDGETPKEAIDRVYKKGNVETKRAETEKYTLNENDIIEISENSFDSKNKIPQEALKNANKDTPTNKIIKNLSKLGKLEFKKVGLDSGAYIPSIMGDGGTIKADTENTFYHELAHSIDHRLGKILDKDNPHFNWLSNDLTEINKEVIEKLNYKLPKDLENKFKELDVEVKNEFKNKYANKVSSEILKKAREKYKDFDKLPLQLKENILNEFGTKIVAKNFADIISNHKDYKKWSVLSDIYSALTMGQDDSSKFLGTHSQEYWQDAIFGLRSGKSANVNSEIFANYVEMRMGNFTEQLQYLKDNEPKLVNKLDTLYNKIASEMDKL